MQVSVEYILECKRVKLQLDFVASSTRHHGSPTISALRYSTVSHRLCLFKPTLLAPANTSAAHEDRRRETRARDVVHYHESYLRPAFARVSCSASPSHLFIKCEASRHHGILEPCFLFLLFLCSRFHTPLCFPFSMFLECLLA